MLAELVKFYTTPCRRYVRRMGYLAESIATEARYKRLQKDWQPHLDNTKKAIIENISKCKKKDRALILGSGHLYDIPLEELAAKFGEVVLVDILHPKHVRNKVSAFINVRLVEQDITGAAEQLFINPKKLYESNPQFFIGEEINFVASVNLLSQLPVIPNKWLRRKGISDALVYGYCKSLVQEHLEYLRKLSGEKCLITDIEFLAEDEDEELAAQESAIYGIDLGKPAKSWIWDIAPAPEIDRQLSFKHKVGVYFNF